jgi:hypothetical protein
MGRPDNFYKLPTNYKTLQVFERQNGFRQTGRFYDPGYVKLYVNSVEIIIYLQEVTKQLNKAACYTAYRARLKCMGLNLTVG